MKKFEKLIFGAICGVIVTSLSTAQIALAAGAYSFQPGHITYDYASPSASLYGTVQVGGSPAANVTQNSTHNISAVAQVGVHPSATVTQTGSVNSSSVVQHGLTSNALTVQFGAPE